MGERDCFSSLTRNVDSLCLRWPGGQRSRPFVTAAGVRAIG
ncbi:hypothetical protein C7S15_6370 [Burkholderia cepacia]|nr:hypothetical protein [Burkholderia cepacia]